MAINEKWNKEQVQNMVRYFNDPQIARDDDVAALARLAVSFDRFKSLHEAGGIEDGEAKMIADTFLKVGDEWMKQHPEINEMKRRVWTSEKVETAIKYFNDPNVASDDDESAMKQLATEFKNFESIVNDGWIEDGRARDLADEFITFGQDWLQKNPTFFAAYQSA